MNWKFIQKKTYNLSVARLLEFLKDDDQTLTVVFDQLIIFKTVFLDFESI